MNSFVTKKVKLQKFTDYVQLKIHQNTDSVVYKNTKEYGRYRKMDIMYKIICYCSL